MQVNFQQGGLMDRRNNQGTDTYIVNSTPGIGQFSIQKKIRNLPFNEVAHNILYPEGGERWQSTY